MIQRINGNFNFALSLKYVPHATLACDTYLRILIFGSVLKYLLFLLLLLIITSIYKLALFAVSSLRYSV